MLAAQDAVNPYGRAVIDSAEVKQPPVSFRQRGQLCAPSIPAGLVEAGVADAAGWRLRGKWNCDLSIPGDCVRTGMDSVGVEREVPPTVEREPVPTAELRPGIAAAGGVKGVRRKRGVHQAKWSGPARCKV